MKRLELLKTLTNIVFALCMITMAFLPPLLLIAIFMPGRIPFKVNGVPADQLGAVALIAAFFIIVAYAFFIYALYLFKGTLALFQKKKIFHEDVIKNFSQTGLAILIGYVISIGTVFFYNLATTNEQHINLDFTGIAQSLAIPALGLFFIVLGDIFAMAKKIKDENDLTI